MKTILAAIWVWWALARGKSKLEAAMGALHRFWPENATPDRIAYLVRKYG